MMIVVSRGENWN